jgi:LmbE family N-acetylglucosaminyl deacetylase
VSAWLRRLMEAVAVDATREVAATSCLVLAPHPDDEVLGCGGTIAQKVRHGASVSIAFLTDGRGGVPGSPEDARALREAEATRAAAALGLPADRLVFLGFEDGRLGDHVEQAAATLREMIAALGVQELFVPYRCEYHADHQAAWRIGDRCHRDGIRVYEYPVWYGPWLWPRLGWRARAAAASHLPSALRAIKVRVAEVAAAKSCALAAYRSQVSAFESRDWGPRFLTNFTGDFELFFAPR